MNWIDSAGGPLLLLENNLLPFWDGIRESKGREIITTFRWTNEYASDYDRACDIDEYLGVLEIGNGQGLVLNDEPFSTTWKSENSLGIFLIVRLIYTKTKISCEKVLNDLILSNIRFNNDNLVFTVSEENIKIFDSGLPGDEIDEYLDIELEKGNYELLTGYYEPDAKHKFLIHKFSLID